MEFNFNMCNMQNLVLDIEVLPASKRFEFFNLRFWSEYPVTSHQRYYRKQSSFENMVSTSSEATSN